VELTVDTDDARAEGFGGAAEQRIDRRAKAVLAGAVAQSNVIGREDQMMIDGSDVHAARFDGLAIARERRRQRGPLRFSTSASGFGPDAVCQTTKTLAEKSAGSAAHTWRIALIPPRLAPITIMSRLAMPRLCAWYLAGAHRTMDVRSV
jgi:hypothetical protein